MDNKKKTKKTGKKTLRTEIKMGIDINLSDQDIPEAAPKTVQKVEHKKIVLVADRGGHLNQPDTQSNGYGQQQAREEVQLDQSVLSPHLVQQDQGEEKPSQEVEPEVLKEQPIRYASYISSEIKEETETIEYPTEPLQPFQPLQIGQKVQPLPIDFQQKVIQSQTVEPSPLYNSQQMLKPDKIQEEEEIQAVWGRDEPTPAQQSHQHKERVGYGKGEQSGEDEKEGGEGNWGKERQQVIGEECQWRGLEVRQQQLCEQPIQRAVPRQADEELQLQQRCGRESNINERTYEKDEQYGQIIQQQVKQMVQQITNDFQQHSFTPIRKAIWHHQQEQEQEEKDHCQQHEQKAGQNERQPEIDEENMQSMQTLEVQSYEEANHHQPPYNQEEIQQPRIQEEKLVQTQISQDVIACNKASTPMDEVQIKPAKNKTSKKSEKPGKKTKKAGSLIQVTLRLDEEEVQEQTAFEIQKDSQQNQEQSIPLNIEENAQVQQQDVSPIQEKIETIEESQQPIFVEVIATSQQESLFIQQSTLQQTLLEEENILEIKPILNKSKKPTKKATKASAKPGKKTASAILEINFLIEEQKGVEEAPQPLEDVQRVSFEPFEYDNRSVEEAQHHPTQELLSNEIELEGQGCEASQISESNFTETYNEPIMSHQQFTVPQKDFEIQPSEDVVPQIAQQQLVQKEEEIEVESVVLNIGKTQNKKTTKKKPVKKVAVKQIGLNLQTSPEKQSPSIEEPHAQAEQLKTQTYQVQEIEEEVKIDVSNILEEDIPKPSEETIEREISQIDQFKEQMEPQQKPREQLQVVEEAKEEDVKTVQIEITKKINKSTVKKTTKNTDKKAKGSKGQGSSLIFSLEMNIEGDKETSQIQPSKEIEDELVHCNQSKLNEEELIDQGPNQQPISEAEKEKGQNTLVREEIILQESLGTQVYVEEKTTDSPPQNTQIPKQKREEEPQIQIISHITLNNSKASKKKSKADGGKKGKPMVIKSKVQPSLMVKVEEVEEYHPPVVNELLQHQQTKQGVGKTQQQIHEKYFQMDVDVITQSMVQQQEQISDEIVHPDQTPKISHSNNKFLSQLIDMVHIQKDRQIKMMRERMGMLKEDLWAKKIRKQDRDLRLQIEKRNSHEGRWEEVEQQYEEIIEENVVLREQLGLEDGLETDAS